MAAAAPGASSGRSAATGLVVAPFRGVRFDPAAVPDLAAVTCPPYDVIDPDGARRLEKLHPYNVVRLILPREDRGGRADRYDNAAATLAAWLESGILIRDARPAIYVYEQSADRKHQRGILAAVGLRAPEERVVLPHEDVMPGPVNDRLNLMRATQANLEPILLVYDGGGTTAEIIDAAAESAPLVEAHADDGVRHRMWAVTTAGDLAAVEADLAPKQALIADGHHRYATYLKLQAERHAAGEGAGPWDFGLALLVDNRRYPLDLQAIHRVVEDLPLEEAVALAHEMFATRLPSPSLDEGLRALRASPRSPTLLLSDGSSHVLVGHPRQPLLSAGSGSGHYAPLDAQVLHEILLERVWRVPDDSGRIRYVHDVEGALSAARRTSGTAVLLRPVDLADVARVAATNGRLPRKSTSFGPKPRTGLVMRLLEADRSIRP